MLNEPIRSVMERKPVLFAAPATCVSDAAKCMAKGNMSAVLVIEDDRLVGIFTERDAVLRVIAQDRDVRTTAIGEVMTRNPVVVSPDEAFGHALAKMQENGVRHLPVVQNGVPVGLISARDALDPELEEFGIEAERRERFRKQSRSA